MWIDAHCHLGFSTFLSPSNDQAAVIQRALDVGVTTLINVGCDLESSRTSLVLAQEHSFIFCTLGVHPNEANLWNGEIEKQFREWIDKDRSQAEGNRIVGIGEIGLDYFRNGASKDVKHDAFRGQISLAQEYDLPIMIHCRDAFEDAFKILDECSPSRVVFHCFSGDLRLASTIWERGWVTSFTAVVSYPKNEGLREGVKACPKELYFLETDAPFLPHQELRGKRNEPAYVPRLGQDFAQLRQEPLDQIAIQSTRNVEVFFDLRNRF